jgi:hypothetical protein
MAAFWQPILVRGWCQGLCILRGTGYLYNTTQLGSEGRVEFVCWVIPLDWFGIFCSLDSMALTMAQPL